MERLSVHRRISAFLLVAFCLTVEAWAGTVETAVSYVSAMGVYLAAGQSQNISISDTGEVRRDRIAIAHIIVVFVADHSASCKILDSTAAIHAGDSVSVAVHEPAMKPEPQVAAPAVQPAPIPLPAPLVKAKSNGTRVTGRAAIQYYFQDSRNAFDINYTQPSLVLRLRAEDLLNSNHTLAIRFRSRRTYDHLPSPRSRNHAWDNRVYEVSWTYDDPQARIGYSAGRIISNRMAGVGYVDGARFDYRAYSHVIVGAFGGTQPDLRTSRFRNALTLTGVYAVYERGDYSTQRLGFTLSGVGEYHHGTISREFVYQQLDWSRGSALSVYERAEIGVHRGWQPRVAGSALKLDNFQLNTRYALTSRFAVTAGYDHLEPFRTYETRTLADSLFDNASQQGYRAGLDLRLPWTLRADARGTIRSRAGESQRAQTLSFGLGTASLLKQRVALNGRANLYRNRFTNGNQIMLSISRNLTARWSAGAQLGRDTYDLRQLKTNYSDRWLRLSTDWTATRHVYSSAYGEFYRGEPFAGTRGSVELGWRF